MMEATRKARVISGVAAGATAVLLAYAWTPLPVREDRNVFMPGSQPGAATLESAGRCDNCHGGYNLAVEPAHNWRGSMMANAARDPLWAACLVVALQDSIWALGNANAGDLCIRCHTPTGWLAGHSDPPNLTALVGIDFEGISCDACHKMTDAVRGLRQTDDLATETDPTAIMEADQTYRQDLNVLRPLTLFDGALFFSPTTDLPAYFGDGSLPHYIEATSGQYFVDASMPKRGPRWDADPKHSWYYSRFHKTKYVCATCHDVSNPVLGRLLSGDMALPERQAGGSYLHVERTFSEFKLSAYAQPGGAAVSPALNLPAGTVATKCQDCHMRDVTGPSANKTGIQTRTDLALHDQTGGNVWVSGILASADRNHPALYDGYNYAILSGAKYPGARIDVLGIQNFGAALADGQRRALQQLQMAATLETVADTADDVTLRVVNHSGHKLISGFPEGRRMWLNVRFYDSAGGLLEEVNPYEPLVVTVDAQGNPHYVAGGTLTANRYDLVYEAGMSSRELTGEPYTFHFVLATDRYKDNRIPPKGFEAASAGARLVWPKWSAVDAPDYFTAEEYAGGYDEVVIAKPGGTERWEARLYYQTTSKEYVEFLRDEIEGTSPTLSSPTPSGEPNAYIAQTDPYFSSLKDWGKAIYDLWLHNGGCPPVLMTSTGVEECAAPATPSGLAATAGRRKIVLTWGAVAGAEGYKLYYDQGGKYVARATVTTPSYTDSGLTPGATYCYAVSAYRACPDGAVGESTPSSPSVCAVPTR